MPKRYEEIRDSLVKEGVPLKIAKGQAARIYNASRQQGEEPVTGRTEDQPKARKKKNA